MLVNNERQVRRDADHAGQVDNKSSVQPHSNASFVGQRLTSKSVSALQRDKGLSDSGGDSLCVLW